MKAQPQETRIALAWKARFDQRLLECRKLVAELKREHLVFVDSDNSKTVATLAADPAFQVKSEVLLLDASLMRADGAREASKAVIGVIDACTRLRQEPDSFSLAIQKALTAYLENNFTRALEGFLSAQAAAASGEEELLARLNALFCLENLGHDVDASVIEAQERLKAIQKREPLITSLALHLDAFALRQAFRMGRWVPVALSHHENATEFSTQRDFYLRWVQSLPFVRKSASQKAARDATVVRDSAYRVYRLRTLQGLDHPEDLGSVPAREWADRLYLWVWKWLQSPDAFPAQRIGTALKEWEALNSPVLSQEDALLVRNALGWLCLFDASAELRVQRWIQKVRPAGMAAFPVFEFEARLQDALRLWVRGESTAAMKWLNELQRQTIVKSKGYLWNEFVENFLKAIQGPSWSSDTFQGLIHGLLEMSPERRAGTGADLVIDLATGSVRARKGEKGAETVSPAMAHAFEVLKENPVISIPDFVARIFGFSRYDALAHDPKVLNLLARMREIAPKGLSFGVKAGRVRVEAGSASEAAWKRVQFQGRHPYVNSLKSTQAWLDFGAFSLPAPHSGGLVSVSDKSSPILALKKLQGKGDVTRAQLEEATGVSRATAARLIQSWVQKGYIRKQGVARNTSYVILLGENA